MDAFARFWTVQSDFRPFLTILKLSSDFGRFCLIWDASVQFRTASPVLEFRLILEASLQFRIFPSNFGFFRPISDAPSFKFGTRQNRKLSP